jgi:hypothetical protein
MPLSQWAAASVTPAEAQRADATARHDDDPGLLDHHRTGHDHDPSIGPTAAIGAAVETGTAAAGGVRTAKARDRGCHQCCRKKIPHIVSLLGRNAAPDDVDRLSNK